MNRSTKHKGRPSSFLAAIVVVTTLAIGAFGLFLNQLQNEVHDAHHRALHALEIRDAIDETEGLEFRFLAGDEADEIGPPLDVAVANVRQEISTAERSAEIDELALAAEYYLAALQDMFVAIDTGDEELAEDIDEERVDPAYERAFALASAIVSSEEETAEQTAEQVVALTWASLIALIGALAATVHFGLGARERRLHSDTDQRFRSLVEGSSDVITVVTGDGDLDVISPTLGALANHASTESPTHVREVFAGPVVEKLLALDQQLATTGGHHRIEITLENETGVTTHVAGHGSVLGATSHERVWVWRDVTAQKELELQLSHQAFHDPLTGTANRSLLQNRVEHALAISNRTNAPVTVMFCDLDNFKAVNDTLGHGDGDELLQIISKRIQSCIRNSDTLARLGGDEFAILLENADTEMAIALSERMLAVVSYEVDLAGQKVFPSMSVGIATAAPGATSNEVLRNADLAMYSAKRSGRGRAEVYEDHMHAVTSDLLELQSDLRAAIEEGQFRLHYQPTVDLETEEIEGFEALIRWEHPQRGNVPPDDFIPVAESSGMIIPIGQWVLNEACRAAVMLSESRETALNMAVNLSPLQLRDPGIVSAVKSALEHSGLPPARLVLEVTEGALLDDHSAIERLEELVALGLQVAIDDFGTGYTSVNYLQNLPISTVKIDRSFVSGDALAPCERQAFLHAIVGLAKSLNLRSVAEGIEEGHQLEELKRLGCDIGQGYLWSPAMPLADANDTIESIDQPAETELSPAD